MQKNKNDLDVEMLFNEAQCYIENIVREYRQLLNYKLNEIMKNNSIITLRKIKRLKNSALFTLLKNVNRKEVTI